MKPLNTLANLLEVLFNILDSLTNWHTDRWKDEQRQLLEPALYMHMHVWGK